MANVSSQFTGRENICSIDANHIDMCKFSSREDVGYQRVTNALCDVFDKLSPVEKGKDGRWKSSKVDGTDGS